MKKIFCSVNAHVVDINRLIRDLKRYQVEADVAGFKNLTVEIDEDKKMWILGEKQ